MQLDRNNENVWWKGQRGNTGEFNRHNHRRILIMNKDIVAWWSGGITSAVACKKAIEMFGLDRVQIVMIDTGAEDEDTYRFKKDCEKWYGLNIQVITGLGSKYESIESVWRKYLSLNTATGAVCSTDLKRKVRIAWQKANRVTYQVFGFEFEKKEFIIAFVETVNQFKRKNNP